jgi:hypothetical protein
MARKTNAEIQQMSIKEAKQYAYDHPAESGRISRELAKAAGTCAKIQLQYTASTVFSPNPSAVTVTL